METMNRVNYQPKSQMAFATENIALNAASTVVGAAANFAIPGLGTALAGAVGGGTGEPDLVAMRRENTNFLRLQAEVNQISTAFQTHSNISKTSHDAQMNSVRNIKA